ncbi:MAG TPA: EAL domain-containing protein [Gammaproteobacteria bacterium]|nr:EAL domain-containing protein [Gammaproteobacteria bacterium]
MDQEGDAHHMGAAGTALASLMGTSDTQILHNILRRQLRPLIIFCGAALIALTVGVAIAARTLMGSYQQLEDSATRQKAVQVYRAFEADLRQLQISNRDYATWDAAEEFMRTRDPAFLPGNFSADTLLGMHVDVVWIVDAAGRDVYSHFVDRAANTAHSPAPAEILESFRRFQARDRSFSEGSPAERTVRTPRGLAGVAATEIARSNGSQPTGAVMLFARLIEATDIARVHDASELPVSLTYLASAEVRTAGLPAEVSAWAAADDSPPTYVRAADSRTIIGYALIRDLDHQPVAVFATESQREIRALGLRTTRYLLSGVVVLFLAFGTTVLALVLRLLTLHKRDFDHRRDAQEQQRTNRRNLAKQAQRDSLTGLPNRLYLHSRLPRLLAKMANSHQLVALVHLDIDYFKNINDSHGHASGDQLLQLLAKCLRATVSTSDLVAHMGGDEFVIVASLISDVATIERFAIRLQAAIGADLIIDEKRVNITASLGIAVYPHDGRDMETLLKHANVALNQAKEAGRRCHRFFAADIGARASEQMALQQALRQAIGTPQIYVDYQPIIDLQDGCVVSLEALVRWRHPEKGLISPVQFIPVAEKSGLILEIGEHVLREVLKQQRAWLDAKVPVVPIAVNVSAIQVERMDFAALVARLTAEAGVPPQWVRFEITESAVMKEPEKLIGTLKTLRTLGSQVLIDDFGTGYSSLSYLARLPVDILKIDRAFVSDLDQEGKQSPIVHAVIDMARRLGLKTVAEGVETAAQAALLGEWGCDYAQGFFYSKPVAAQHCRALLEHLRRERPLTDTMIMRAVGG